MLSVEDYILLAPGLTLGRLSAEPWLALVGIAIGIALPRWWLVVIVALIAGGAWGLTSIGGGHSGIRTMESAYLAALPVVVTALATYVIKRFIRTTSTPVTPP